MTNQTKQSCVCAVIALFGVLLVGCGDDDVVPTVDAGSDGGPRDAAIDAALAVDAGVDAGPASCPSTRILVTTSDYMTGGLGTVDLGLTAAVRVAVAAPGARVQRAPRRSSSNNSRPLSAKCCQSPWCLAQSRCREPGPWQASQATLISDHVVLNTLVWPSKRFCRCVE